jgi:hypothetical protein
MEQIQNQVQEEIKLAMLKLTNGREVWDLSGNVSEWVNKTQTHSYLQTALLKIRQGLVIMLVKMNMKLKENLLKFILNLQYLQDIGYKDLFLLNSDYNRDNGLGYFSNYYFGSDIAFLRGGLWNSDANAGVLRLYAGRTPSHSNDGIGFRWVVAPE